MVDWVLTAGLQNLRSQVNARWPHRDKASDGTIGDAAHAAGVSGHNPDDSPYDNAEWDGDSDSTPEVRAWDMDDDLGEPGTTAQMIVDHFRQLPGFSSVNRYMIYNRYIYRSSTGYARQAYSGPSAHTEHIHFSGAYSQASDNNTGFDYRLEEVGEMALTTTDANVLIDQMGARLKVAAPDDDFVKYMRAVVWQYTGGGLQGSTSTLDALSDTQNIQAQLITLTSAVAGISDVDEAALAASVAEAMIGPLTASILADIPETGLTADEVEARVEAGVRHVLLTGASTPAG